MKDFSLKLDHIRRLVFDFTALNRVAERFKPKDSEIPPEEEPVAWIIGHRNFMHSDIIALALFGLLWEDATLTEEKVQQLFDQAIQKGDYIASDLMMLVLESILVQYGISLSELKNQGKTDAAPGAKEQKKGPGPKLRIPTTKKNGE